jgi:hypothetical protein
MRNMTTIEQPYMGRWQVLENRASIGVVSGDFAVGFIAQDQDDRVLGHYPTYERAMYAVMHQPSADYPARRNNPISAT